MLKVKQIREALNTDGTIKFCGLSGGIANRGTTIAYVNGEPLNPNESIGLASHGHEVVYDMEFEIIFQGSGANKIVAHINQLKPA